MIMIIILKPDDIPSFFSKGTVNTSQRVSQLTSLFFSHFICRYMMWTNIIALGYKIIKSNAVRPFRKA